MNIGQRLYELRAAKGFSQGDVEKRTGLFRCYISRVENGHTIPSLETLEKVAAGLEINLSQLFEKGGEKPRNPPLTSQEKLEEHRLVDSFKRLGKEGQRVSAGDDSGFGKDCPVRKVTIKTAIPPAGERETARCDTRTAMWILT